MLVEKTEPYPHHRSFWFADTIRPAGGERDLSFYYALASGVRTEAGDFGPPFRDRIRLESFTRLDAGRARAAVDARLVWESDGQPVLDEARRLVIHSLGEGEYLLDLSWTLTASYGEISLSATTSIMPGPSSVSRPSGAAGRAARSPPIQGPSARPPPT